MERPTLRQLEYVVALAEHLHFGRAAEACHVSQPGLSTQLRKLEENLGVRLFERNRRRVMATPEGEEVVARARRILRETDDLVAACRAAGGVLTGTVRMGVIPTVAPYLLPRILPEVRARWPELRLILTEDRTARILASLAAGRLDLLLLALPAGDASVETIPLFREHFVLAAPAGHPLLDQESVAAEDLAGRQVLLLTDGHCFRDQALALCAQVGAKEAGDLRATSLNTLVQMVANGLGVTLLPSLAVAVEVRPGSPVQVRPFRRPAPSREIGLAWRRTDPHADDYRRLGALLKSRLPALLEAPR